MSRLCKRKHVKLYVILREYMETRAKGEKCGKGHQKETNGFPGSDMNEHKL
jgi:hypothetical protein